MLVVGKLRLHAPDTKQTVHCKKQEKCLLTQDIENQTRTSVAGADHRQPSAFWLFVLPYNNKIWNEFRKVEWLALIIKAFN